jgi:hygromycin-B 7''-O-kinase
LNAPPVILTGEFIPENFLLRREMEGWHVSGLIDFGDVMTGWGEYDLLGPSAFMTAGVPRRVRSLFKGFGYSAADITPDLKRRLMALMLLHRASDPVRASVSRVGSTRPRISVNYRICSGPFERRTSIERPK